MAAASLLVASGPVLGTPQTASEVGAGKQSCGVQRADVRLVQHEWSVVVGSYAADRMRQHKRFMTYLRQTLDVIRPLKDGCTGENALDAFMLDIQIITTRIAGDANETDALRKGARHGSRWATQMGLQHPAFRTL
jgi:hypothetical protein